MAFCDYGYTTNLPLEDVTDGKAWVVDRYEGSRWTSGTAGPRGCWCRTALRQRLNWRVAAASGVPSGTTFVCGSRPFVDAGSDLLLDVGFDVTAVRTERFGLTG